MADITNILKNTVGSGLEREAYKQFGNAVDDFASGALAGIFPSTRAKDLTKPEQSYSSTSDIGIWEPTKYSAALVETGDYRPRLKFLFKVTFEIDQDIASAISKVTGGNEGDIQRELTFMVKSVDKPKIDFEYEEVNMYNYRTKVLKKITHQEMNLVFYDDTGNRVFDFINMYRMAHQPIARMQQLTTVSGSQHEALENNGFAFSDVSSALDSGMRGNLPGGNKKSLITKMVVHQYYVNAGADIRDKTQIVKVNDFVFVHPRAVSLDMDDLDHEQGDQFNIATMRFDYDALYMSSGNIPTEGNLSPEFPGGDIMMAGGRENNMREGGKGQEISRGGTKNPFLDVLARQGGRAAQQIISGALNKTGLGSIAGGALGGAIYKVSGALGNAAGGTLRDMAAGVSQGLAIPSFPFATSNAVGGTAVGQKKAGSE